MAYQELVTRISESGLPLDLVQFEGDGLDPSLTVINPDKSSALRSISIEFNADDEILVVVKIAGLREENEGYWWKSEAPDEDLIAVAVGWLEAFINGHLVFVQLTPRIGHLLFDVRDPGLRGMSRFRGHPTISLSRFPPIRPTA